jgi:hypothetical protein
MERVETLSKMLADKIEKRASYDDILVTVKMIESELQHLKTIQPIVKNVEKPTTKIDIFRNSSDDLLDSDMSQEKIIEVLQINEKEVEAELEEIRHNLNHLAFMASKNKPAFKIEEEQPGEQQTLKDLHPTEIKLEKTPEIIVEKTPIINDEEITIAPAQTPIKEINETVQTANVISINDRLNMQQHEISDKLKDAPIEDLKKAIGVNERFLYLNELFRNDDIIYDKSIKTINAFTNFEDAELWIRKELKLRLGWDDNYNTVKQFYGLVRRRFS